MKITTVVLLVLVCLVFVANVSAQEVLPQPQPPFKGKIERTAKDSTPDFPKGVEAPKGAPNVLLILTDDVGFGASSTFGGPIQTPNFQRLADSGLRYTMFHTTALCSPTRAALITGRNHHTNASGVITEMATGYPGYNSLVPKSSGSVGEVLRENGYNTSWFGKMHNIPDWMSSQAGPIDLWPSGLGFREILLVLWREQGSPLDGYILAGKKKRPVILDNVAKRSIRDRIEAVNRQAAEKRSESKLSWPGWYALRRFHGTQVCVEADSETAADALRNSKEVAKAHYIKPTTVLPKTRDAVTRAVAGLA